MDLVSFPMLSQINRNVGGGGGVVVVAQWVYVLSCGNIMLKKSTFVA